MQTIMKIHIHYGDDYNDDGGYAGYHRTSYSVTVPEPYQAGEDGYPVWSWFYTPEQLGDEFQSLGVDRP